MTRADLERYQDSLLTLRRRLSTDVVHLLDEALRSRGDPTEPAQTGADQAELSTESYEQEFTLHLLQNQEHTLEEIDAALQRIQQGQFGRCLECGGPISRGRLSALPYARHCVACAHKLQ